MSKVISKLLMEPTYLLELSDRTFARIHLTIFPKQGHKVCHPFLWHVSFVEVPEHFSCGFLFENARAAGILDCTNKRTLQTILCC
jgi:hypothetical protein